MSLKEGQQGSHKHSSEETLKDLLQINKDVSVKKKKIFNYNHKVSESDKMEGQIRSNNVFGFVGEFIEDLV